MRFTAPSHATGPEVLASVKRGWETLPALKTKPQLQGQLYSKEEIQEKLDHTLISLGLIAAEWTRQAAARAAKSQFYPVSAWKWPCCTSALGLLEWMALAFKNSSGSIIKNTKPSTFPI